MVLIPSIAGLPSGLNDARLTGLTPLRLNPLDSGATFWSGIGGLGSPILCSLNPLDSGATFWSAGLSPAKRKTRGLNPLDSGATFWSEPVLHH